MDKKIRLFIHGAVLILFSGISGIIQAQPKGEFKSLKAIDVLSPATSSSVKIEGYLGKKLDLCIENRVMVQDIERIIRPFRERYEHDYNGWRCDYWGKWFTSAMQAYSYSPTSEHKAVIKEGLDKLLKTQSPDGYIGTFDQQHSLDGWDIWGQKCTLLGLTAYYDYFKDKIALDAAFLVADQLLTKVGPGKVNIAENGMPLLKGLPSTTILKAITLLYERTGNENYLDFAKYIVEQWSKPNKFMPTGLQLVENALAQTPPLEMLAMPKAYEMTENFVGLLELYRATGEKQYLEAGIRFGNSVRKYERMINGSCSNQELWCDGARSQVTTLEQPMETCVTVYWMKYCNQLLQLTGDPLWADELETSLYNALLGAMTPKGEWFAYFSPLAGERVPSHVQHDDVGLSCCVANGPRGLLLTPEWALMNSQKGLVVNLYSRGSYSGKLADGTEIRIIQSTDYPVDDKIDMVIQMDKPKKFTIGLRIPEWSTKNELNVNREIISCSPGTYAQINRTWTSGDKITLKLDLRGRVIHAPGGSTEIAIMRGPVLLALDNRLTGQQDTLVRLISHSDSQISPVYEFAAPEEADLPPIAQVNPRGYTRIKPALSHAAPQQYVDLVPVKSKPDDVWMAFMVPFHVRPSHFFNHHDKTLVMCDYASAGNKWNEKNLFRVWMPQPMYMNDMYPANTWKLILPGAKNRPGVPEGKHKLTTIRDIF